MEDKAFINTCEFHFLTKVYMSKYKNYNIESIKSAAAESTSIASFLRKLGLQDKGGNYQTARVIIDEHNIDTSHWTGSTWSKGKFLKEEGGYQRPNSIKKHLISIRGHQCQSCDNVEWLGKPITLELEHVDGDSTNNLYDNLKLFCPNCHSQTPTWRRRKNSL